VQGAEEGPGINGTDLEQLATCCASSLTLQELELFHSVKSKQGQKKATTELKHFISPTGPAN